MRWCLLLLVLAVLVPVPLLAPTAAAQWDPVERRAPAAPRMKLAAVTAPTGSLWRAPLAGPLVVTRAFAPPTTPYGPGHRGVDLAAEPGLAVQAAGSGVVTVAGLVAGTPVVTVGHADGLRTTYEPVRARVRVGAAVAVGSTLGTVLAGHPGCPRSACLHWGLIKRGASGDEYLDPLTLLGLGPPRLLPLG